MVNEHFHARRNAVSGSSRGAHEGFTLLELIVVLLILALIMGVSYPSMERGSNILNLQTASRDVLNTFRFAREKAVSEQASMMLIIDRNERRLQLANILGEPMQAYTLPRGVHIQRMMRAGNEVQENTMTVRFAPNGGLENVGIRLATDSGSRMQIISDPLGGGARIEPVWEDYK
jgi:prepilin-type N-terminal cleavage/methylation domain-containing protein